MRRALLAALAISGAAHAQEVAETPCADSAPCPATSPSDSVVVFEAAFFARFSPQNAWDMVSRVPGFTVDEGADRRGFSGAVGNVLIDGRRLSTKNQELDDVLARVPAAQVLRIELIRDAASRSDAAGQSTLVNVVRTPSAGAGIWEGTLEYRDHDRVSPSGQASWTGRSGALEYTLGVSRRYEYYPIEGQRFYSDGAGNLDVVRTDLSPRNWRRAVANADASFPLFGGAVRVNGQIDRYNFRLSIDQFDHDPGGVFLQEVLDLVDERQQNEELGFNFERRFGPVALEVIGLANRGHFASDDSTEIRAASPTRIAQRRRNESAETIGRATLSVPMTPAHRLDIGGEVAFNSLDASQELTIDEGAGPVAIELPAANVLVEESRAEGFVTLAWRAGERWMIESTLAAELSTLTQSGDTELETELAYLKPSFQVTRRIGERDQVRVRVYRDVDQLNFNDFVSFAGLADNLVVGGNPNLLPENSWRAEIAGDWRFNSEGALGLRFFRHWLEDASDVVPVGPPGAQFDAPGNIGDGYQQGVQLTATVALGFLIPGGRFTADNTWWDTEVTDPVTGGPRRISIFPEAQLEMSFRQDLPAKKLAWGVNYFKQEGNVTFRINEIDRYEEGPFLDLFAESTAIRGIKVRAYAYNLLDTPFVRKREFFDGTRLGALVLTEDRLRTRHWGRFYGLTVSGTF